MSRLHPWIVVLFFSALGCSDEPVDNNASDSGPRDAEPGDGGAADGGVVDMRVAEMAFLNRIVGLWSGPATRTPLGDFRMMNVDFRAASDQFFFGRVDLDEDNALRFGFSIETHGADVLTYRNGGYFLGLLRDDRTVLLEHDPVAETFRFCHVARGCEYLDVLYDFEGPDRLAFDVLVRGATHVDWDARRIEARSIEPGILEGLTSQGSGQAPFPTMPELVTTVRWAAPLPAPSPVWIILSVNGCSLSGCLISRHLRTLAPAGATEAVLRLEQVHAGSYSLLAVLDRDGNLEALGGPDSGDGISLPATVDVALPMTTAAASIVIDLP